MSPLRTLGATGLVLAAALACTGAEQDRVALAVVALAPMAMVRKLGGVGWLAGVVGVVLAYAVGWMALDTAATSGAVCVVLAGLSGPTALAPVGAALVLAIAAASLRDLRFLLPLMLCGVSVPLVLLGHQRSGWRLAWRPWLGTLAVTAAVTAMGFALVPRVGVAPRKTPALTGFQARVDLDDVTALLDDPTLIARVEVIEGTLTPPVTLRGVALQHFDGLRWTAPASRQAVAAGVGDAPVQVQVQPLGRIDEGALFGLGPIRSASVPAMVDDAGNWWGAAAASEAYVVGLGVLQAPEDPEAWMTVPRTLDPRIPALSRQWAGDERDPVVLARLFTSALQDQALYTRHPPTGGGDDPLADFLFGSRAGHCEHWATALAVLLRTRGIAARPVNGFVDLEPDGDGYIVHRSDAHAWVEVFDGARWFTIDPTPRATERVAAAPVPITERVGQTWQSDIVGWDVVRQRRAARHVVSSIASRPWTMLFLYGAAVVLALAWWLVRGDRSTLGAWTRARSALARHGLAPPETLPPVHAAEWVVERVGPDADGLVALAWRVYRVRYGGEADSAHRLAAMREARELMRQMGNWTH